MQIDYPPVDVCACMRIDMYMCVMHVSVYMSICMYVCMYVHACAYTRILLFSTNNKKKSVYRIYPRYSDTSTPYHACSKILAGAIFCPMLCLRVAG